MSEISPQTQQASEYALSDRISRIDTSRIRRMFDLATTLKDPINLSIGQPHFRMPEPIREGIEKALRDGHTSYTQTQGILPLRERLAQKFQEINGFHAHPDHILVSSGVASLLQLLFEVYLEKGMRVLLIEPYFLIYKSMLDFFQVQTEMIPETFTEADVSRIDPDGISLILYSSPSNPSGTILSSEQITALGNLADKSGALLVADEIYELFDYDQKFCSAPKIYPRAMSLMGFSKTYNMTGLRLAAATGPLEIINAMIKLQQYTVVCAPAPAQWGGIVALDLDMSEEVDAYRRNRDRVVERLHGRYEFNTPSGAFYIFPRIKGDDERFAERAVQEKSLLVVPGSIFTRETNRIRVSFAVAPDTLERGLDALIDLS